MPHLPTSLSALPLQRNLRIALTNAGYTTVEDLTKISPEDLSTELGINILQAEHTIQQAKQWLSQIQSSTAADLLSTSALPHFSTFSSSLDALISQFNSSTDVLPLSKRGEEFNQNGSIVPGMSIEISGPPGGGKSSIALAIAMSARHSSGNFADSVRTHDQSEKGEVLLIDTEGSMTSERLFKAAQRVHGDTKTLKSFLKGFHLVRIFSQAQMISFIYGLSDWLESHPTVNLVVIDTLSFHFRQPGLDLAARRKIMELRIRCKQTINHATALRRCAVVVCNQLATKLFTAESKPASFETSDRAVLMPQLGDWWTTNKTLRLVVFRGGGGDELRYVYASMSGSNKNIPWAAFDISKDGLPCDVPELTYQSCSQAHMSS
ncbi:DNA repair protein Rad51, putative [Cryptococcus gattii WM276]|uniref:DNA repair protein Rad51, putative n=1 Tax=Cryptococcus gattii serotype B (strain WM276 / ATCC MYA-4071) TaxID=367775 RepID=E6QXI8_CRYGW|nr:DNA repair protein Rad51, putative [Cryptococcus gattii WM276]ADV19572.1 DNA repair protein Rad51, putative [Cryptococcus gattii WM276]KJE00163.1 RAD51-like protein 2 [Cryptococcus gattii NT-10]